MNSRSRWGPSKTGQVDARSITDDISPTACDHSIPSYFTYHQLSHHRFIEVLYVHVDALGYQISPIHMFLFHTPFPFLQPGRPLSLQATRLSILFRFSPVLQCCHLSFGGSADSEKRQVGSAAPPYPGHLSAWCPIRRPGIGAGRKSAMTVTMGRRQRRTSLFGLRVTHEVRIVSSTQESSTVANNGCGRGVNEGNQTEKPPVFAVASLMLLPFSSLVWWRMALDAEPMIIN
jgi:hypothetical protein